MKLYCCGIVLCLLIASYCDGVLGKESYAPRNPVQSHKSKECPPGYTLKGKACELLEVVEPNYVCPPGTSSSAGRCVTQAPVKLVCPTGFLLKGNSCTRVITAPADYYCDEGALEGKSCKILVPRSPYCPNGYRMEGSSCVRFAPILKKCPAGYSQQGKECSKRVTFPASPSCNVGFELSNDGEKCFKFEERKPYCPTGYQMAADGQCTRFVSKVKAPCPVGYKDVGNRCEMTEQFPAEVLCPEDMTLEQQTKTCVKTIPVPPQCPAGFVPSKYISGQCERYLPSRPVCPPGTVPSGNGQCKQKIVTEKYPKCQNGYEMVGEKCKKVEEFPTRNVCLSGRLQGESCLISETLSPQYACPEGFKLTKTSKGPHCTQTVQYDCSTKTTRKECEMPEFVDQLVPSARKLKGEYAPPTPTVRPYVAKSKQPVCRQVPVTIPKTCTKQETAPIQYICPEGGALVGKSCRLDSLFPADVTCTAGDMDVTSGRCLKVSVAMPTWHCASGTDAGKNCVQYETLPADYVCPEGTVEETDSANTGNQLRCVERKAEISFPDKVVKQKARVVCSEGRLVGKLCMKTVHQPQEYMCPDGSFAVEGHGSTNIKCAVAAELIAPPPVEIKVNPAYVCPDGKPASNKLCYTVESAPIEEYCPAGMNLDNNGKCAALAELIVPSPTTRQVPAKAICNDGYTLQGKSCRSIETMGADKVCPVGYDLATDSEKEVCEREHEMQAVCPAGTMQRAEGCTRRKVVAPEVTIVKTCTKGSPGCH